MPKNGTLLIARHHESLWNERGMWTGSRDIHLTVHGREMSRTMGLHIRDYHIDIGICSNQHRSLETLTEMLFAMEQKVPIVRTSALDERNYGDYTGKNKLAMKEFLGEEEYNRMHREWAYPIPNGESLKMVYERAVPYYLDEIVPKLQEGKNVLVVSHGNTIRALIKYIERISDDAIKDVEMLFGSVLIYHVDKEGRMMDKAQR